MSPEEVRYAGRRCDLEYNIETVTFKWRQKVIVVEVTGFIGIGAIRYCYLKV